MAIPAVFVFVMKGCGACEEFMPRFTRLATPYYQHGLPIGVYDIAKDPRAAKFGDHLGVTATPTTIVRTRHGRSLRRIGSVSDAEIVKLLRGAVT